MANRQPQARAAACLARRKRLEQALAQLSADTGPAVTDAEQRLLVCTVQGDLQGAARRAVLDGVVQQVARELAQHPVVGVDWGGCGADFKIQVTVGQQRRQVQRHVAHHLRPVRAGGGDLLAQLGHPRQRQHLVGQHGGPVHGVADLLQRLGGRHIAAQCRLHLHLEHGQRCAQLVRGIAHKAFLVVQQVLQAPHDAVGGVNQRQQLARCIAGQQRLQLAIRALLQLLAQAPHWPGGALHHHNHHQRNHRDQHRLPPQCVEQDLARQGAPQLQRLGHLYHRHHACLRHGDGLQQHGHPHRFALMHIVIKIHQR